MKWIKLLIIVLSLSMPIHSYACWDDDWDDDDSGWYDDEEEDDWDDWWNDDEEDDDWDEDYAWEVDLPDVVVTPDDDDSWNDSDDDWWRTDSDDDDDWDGGNDDWWDNDDDNPNVGSNENNTYFSNVKHFGNYSPSENEIDINRKSFVTLPASWPSQNTKMGCMSTVLEYVSNYLNGSLTSDSYVSERVAFEVQYNALFNSDLTTDGVVIENMEKFFTECGFDVEHVYFPYEVMGYISEGYPVIASAENNSDGSTAHEVFIVGYFSDTGDFQTVNPSDGSYETRKFEDFYLKSIFVIKK